MPGASSLPEPISREAPANRPNWLFDGSRRFVTVVTDSRRYRQRFFSGTAGFQRLKIGAARNPSHTENDQAAYQPYRHEQVEARPHPLVKGERLLSQYFNLGVRIGLKS
jgi:hypothetical protein